jgi:hypothetical protein
MLAAWIVTYFAVLWIPAHRPLWYDELFTYHVSMSPTFDIFVNRVRYVDLNPPLSYLFVRASIALFGDSPFVMRLPSLLEYLGASLIVYRLVSRRLGGALGLAALGILWSFSLTAYAVEARPYALLLFLFSIAMVCWLNAAQASHWTKWHAGLAAASAGMVLTHCFSPICVATIGAGELVRTIVRKRVDMRVWTVVLLPLGLVPLYIPLVRNAQAYAMAPVYVATLATIPMSYLRIAIPVLPAIGVMMVLWIAGRKKKAAGVAWRDLAQPHEIAFSIAAVVLPTVIIAYCIRSGIAYWPRYGMGAAVGGSLLATALLAKVTKRNVEACATAAVSILVLFCFTKAGTQLLTQPFERESTAYRTIRSELPFVASCGLTFLEMDHRESPEFAKRLFYLTDMESAFRYVHATGFEGFPAMQRWVPFRATVTPYREFVKHNRQFLVLATPDCPLEWLLRKLKDDGAEIRLLQDQKTGYRDHQLYEVTLRAE